ncbi:Copia protein Gag-int-pol protein Copia VLP protein Copia protease [Larimichthys crocea]|uniref:Copia protein Gag-int-pol protein Copia VLP protein Copia protease n=1 Tax=Larimichthys crocea TaxID=215358 RepID=A0A6G0J2S8_LARCR|nr:Copia protein Gag-int-pol protein Copia VLP protein Copia protease [Larimichthys crocea]
MASKTGSHDHAEGGETSEVERRKLDKKAVKLRFVGYANNAKGYRLFDEEKRKILIRRDVIFNETDFDWKQEVEMSCSDSDAGSVPDESGASANETPVTEAPRECGRIRKAPKRYGYEEFADIVTVEHYANVCSVKEPTTMKEAMLSSNAKEWKEAADLEYESLLENETWDLVELPKDRKPIGQRWVFKVKHHSDGEVERYKCRLVAKGYSQNYGVDYDETFSPVVRFSSIRTLLSFAVQNNLHVHQMDVVTAFLNGHLEEEIYMEQPDGYIKPGQEHLVCKLKKSIYGLKQSPRCWSKTFTESMKDIGFNQSTSDPCVFVRARQELEILAVYVDDLILITESLESMTELKVALKKKYKMKDMGELSYILGISVIQDKTNNSVYLHQKHYIEAVLQKYGMDKANPVTTPADANVKLQKDDGVSNPVNPGTYQSIVGSLLYAAMATRPDIAQAVSAVSKFNAKPNTAHMTAVKRILRYLKGTINLALKYQRSESETLLGFSDADWAGDQDDRRSTTGNIFLLGGGAVYRIRGGLNHHNSSHGRNRSRIFEIGMGRPELAWRLSTHSSR